MRRGDVWSWLKRMWEVAPNYLAIIGAATLVLATFAPTSLFVSSRSDIVAAVAVLALQAVTLTLYQLRREVRSYAAAGDAVYGDIESVFAEIWRSPRRFGRTQTLDVLGHDLAEAWPRIATALNSSSLSGWSITVYCLTTERASDMRLPPHWRRKAQENQEDILRWLDDEHYLEKLNERRITLTLKTYDCVPSLHGYSVNGDIYFSHLKVWGSKRVVDESFYEKIPVGDATIRGQKYRALFNGWLQLAESEVVSAYSSSDRPGPPPAE